MIQTLDEINKYVNILFSNIVLNTDYREMEDGMRKEATILVVEGATDKKFIMQHKVDHVICVEANKVFLSAAETINCKNTIIKTISALALNSMSTRVRTPDMEKWTVYGMIDRDYDAKGAYDGIKTLLVTDTHDLETLQLSTDPELLKKIDVCVISDDDIRIAYYIAYQIGQYRPILQEEGKELELRYISGGTSEVAFDKFVERDYRVSLRKLVKYINTCSEKQISAPKEKKITDRVLANKALKKLLTKDNTWKTPVEDFDVSTVRDFWDIVNGHVILSALRFINSDAGVAFRGRGSSLNRKFEMALIDKYDHSRFPATELGARMIEENLIHA